MSRISIVHDKAAFVSRIMALDWKEVPSQEEPFMNKLINCIFLNLSNEHFGVQNLADAIHLSRSQLNRKLKALNQPSGASFILHIRMQYAAYLLAKKRDSISRVGSNVGYKDPAHFCRAFKRIFNCTPSAFKKKYQVTSGEKAIFLHAQNWQKIARN